MNVLSLFDGMACGLVALKRAGIKVNNYYASEIDKYAIQIAKKNHPEIAELGSIENYESWNLPKIDLIIGGSPCQGFSFAGKQLNFDDPRSALFFKFVECVWKFKPDRFLMENVKMKKEYQDAISELLEVEPIEINSALVSAQNRKRLYWCNWDVEQPADKGIYCQGIIDKNNLLINSDGWQRWWRKNAEYQIRKKYGHIMRAGIKSITMTARQVSSWNGNLVYHSNGIRFLSTTEAERLQTLPDNYTEGVSNTQRYKMIGNGWTVDVIAHILKGIS